MKRLFKNLFYVKLGTGLLSVYLTQRKKKQAVKSIEQSDFFEMMQRVKVHPNTHRSDGFFKVIYRFTQKLDDSIEVVVRASNYRPIDRLSVKDGLEIDICWENRRLSLKQTIQKRAFVETEWFPELLKKTLFGIVHVEKNCSDADLTEAYRILNEVLAD